MSGSGRRVALGVRMRMGMEHYFGGGGSTDRQTVARWLARAWSLFGEEEEEWW